MQHLLSFFRKNNFLNLKLFLWLCLIYFPLFLNLGDLVMQKWDESRYGDSSYEMLHGSNPFVVTYFNEPSMDSAKPPLMHWIQALSIAVLGFNETAVRLPSALAGFAICLAIMVFSVRKLHSFSFGAIATFLLVGTGATGFCGFDHSVRTGDYEGLLAAFSFLGVMSFYQYNENPARNKYLRLTFLFILLAVLTKAVAGLFFIPGMVLYLVVAGNLKITLKNKWFYIYAIAFVSLVAFVLLMREHYSPGYLQALNEWELLGRHNTVKDGHEGDYWYYLRCIKEWFDWFFICILLGWLLGLSSPNARIRRFSVFTLILSVSFYMVLSSSESKLRWYAFPLLPILAMQGAIFIWLTLKFLGSAIRKLSYNHLTFFYLSIVLLFATSYASVVGEVYHFDEPEGLHNYNNLQHYLKEERKITRNCFLLATPNDTQGQYLFYFYKLNDKGFNLKYQKVPGVYAKGDRIIIEDPVLQAVIERDYVIKVIDEYSHLKVFEIVEKKV